MFAANNKISLRQLQVLLILDIFGTSVIILPRNIAKVAGNDAWISVLIGSLIMATLTLVLTKFGERYPDKTVVEHMSELFSRPVGFILSMGLALKLVLSAGLELRIFCEIIRQIMLFRTPIWVTAATMLLVCVYVAAGGYECRGRVGEILFVLAFLPFLFVLAAVGTSADYKNLLPAFTHTPSEVWKGTLITMLSFQGLEFLFLVFPYLERPKEAKKGVFSATLLAAMLMTVIVILAIATFGEISVKNKLFPVLQMIDTVDFPGAILERQDMFMMWFWMVSAFASVSASIFFVTIILQRAFQREKTRTSRWLFLVAPGVFLIMLLPSNIATAFKSMEKIKYYGDGFYILILPFVLLFFDSVKRRMKS